MNENIIMTVDELDIIVWVCPSASSLMQPGMHNEEGKGEGEGVQSAYAFN